MSAGGTSGRTLLLHLPQRLAGRRWCLRRRDAVAGQDQPHQCGARRRHRRIRARAAHAGQHRLGQGPRQLLRRAWREQRVPRAHRPHWQELRRPARLPGRRRRGSSRDRHLRHQGQDQRQQQGEVGRSHQGHHRRGLGQRLDADGRVHGRQRARRHQGLRQPPTQSARRPRSSRSRPGSTSPGSQTAFRPRRPRQRSPPPGPTAPSPPPTTSPRRRCSRWRASATS